MATSHKMRISSLVLIRKRRPMLAHGMYMVSPVSASRVNFPHVTHMTWLREIRVPKSRIVKSFVIQPKICQHNYYSRTFILVEGNYPIKLYTLLLRNDLKLC